MAISRSFLLPLTSFFSPCSQTQGADSKVHASTALDLMFPVPHLAVQPSPPTPFSRLGCIAGNTQWPVDQLRLTCTMGRGGDGDRSLES